MIPSLEVCAAIIIRDGRLLLATRRPGPCLAERWEFPGGKVHPDETLADCIARELQEELALAVKQASLLFSCRHPEPKRILHLHFLQAEIFPGGDPVPCEGQRIGWFRPEQLSNLAWMPADALVVENIRLGRWQNPEYPEDNSGLPRLANGERTRELQQWLKSK